MRLRAKTTVLLGLFSLTLVDTAIAKDVNRLLYYNSGGYTVNYVELHWKDGDHLDSKRWGKDLTIGKGFCVNIQKLNRDRVANEQDPVPEGAEVWLKFDIAGGDKESCRKSENMIFDPEGGSSFYFSKGTARYGNRCRRSKPPTSVVVNSGSGNCPFELYY